MAIAHLLPQARVNPILGELDFWRQSFPEYYSSAQQPLLHSNFDRNTYHLAGVRMDPVCISLRGGCLDQSVAVEHQFKRSHESLVHIHVEVRGRPK